MCTEKIIWDVGLLEFHCIYIRKKEGYPCRQTSSSERDWCLQKKYIYRHTQYIWKKICQKVGEVLRGVKYRM